MTRGKFSLFAVVFMTAVFLISCGEHSFWDELSGWLEVSSSSDGLSGEASSSSYGSNGGTPSNSGRATSAILGTVGPLLQTKWDQGSPYSDMLPATGQGICGIIATAQIMKYYKHPARGKGQSGPWTYYPTGGGTSYEMPSVNFEIDYDWDNMLNSYDYNSNATEQQKNAVATFIYHKAAGSMADNFGYRGSFQLYYRTVETYAPFDDDAIYEAIIRQQLNAGMPIYAVVGNHAAIIDGYDSTGRKFHFNCGWGGNGDRWYSLNDYICVDKLADISLYSIPDDGYAGHELVLRRFITANKTSVSQNELFLVAAEVINVRGEFPGGQTSSTRLGQFGAALVDNNGNIVEVIGSLNLERYDKKLRWVGLPILSFVPETVMPGRYSLMVVAKPQGGSRWELVEQSIAEGVIPKAIEITVNAGEATGGGYGLALEENFTASKTTVSQNEAFTVNYKLSNVTWDNFNGDVGAALVDNNGRIISVVGSEPSSRRIDPVIISEGSTYKRGTISSVITDCSVPATVPPGQYQLRMVAKKSGGDWRIVNMLGIGTASNSGPRIRLSGSNADLATAMSLQSNVSSSINFVVR
jgi:hypothetical protein